MKKWARSLHQPNLPLENGKYVTSSKEHIALSKKAATEGIVLLKNENQVLPLSEGTKVALFGKGSFDYVKGGGGSGDVHARYIRNLYDGIKELGEFLIYEPLSDFYREHVKTQYEAGIQPGLTVEPMLPNDLLQGARAFTDTAIITLSRFSGEGWDRGKIKERVRKNQWEMGAEQRERFDEIFPFGDFYITDEERSVITSVKEIFHKVIILFNNGGAMDTSWMKEDTQIQAGLLIGQGGMEGGLAAAEILAGKASPSGKLSDTYAAHIEDYPSTKDFFVSDQFVDYSEDIYVGYRYFETIPGARDKVCYPFGFGLSYTTFAIRLKETLQTENRICFSVEVENTGNYFGKEVVQVYYSAPQGVLGKPARQLAAFAKTKELLPGEKQMLTLEFDKNTMASYDDTGKIQKSTYVLEAGTYEFYVGNSAWDVVKADFSVTVSETEIVQQLSEKATPTSLAKRMLSDGTYEELQQYEPHDPEESIFEKVAPGMEDGLAPIIRAKDRHIFVFELAEGARPLLDVVEGKLSLDEFIAQIPDEQLIDLLGGQPNLGVANTFGVGNLREYGVPSIMTADGPAGLRIYEDTGVRTTAWPCATTLACTWNAELVEEVGKAGAKEVKENNIAIWLMPAVNIHRNPLCGRNFEYYSEDPLLTGKIGAAMVRGIQSQHIAATVKHFACNNKEENRKFSDSRVSERALREIYLKGFEIIVKESDPWAIMSSYNIINGIRASESKELLEDILRGEWNFQGAVMSDWWTYGEHYKEIKAGNDIKMATGYTELVLKAMEQGVISRAEIERSAKRVLELIMKID